MFSCCCQSNNQVNNTTDAIEEQNNKVITLSPKNIKNIKNIRNIKKIKKELFKTKKNAKAITSAAFNIHPKIDVCRPCIQWQRAITTVKMAVVHVRIGCDVAVVPTTISTRSHLLYIFRRLTCLKLST